MEDNQKLQLAHHMIETLTTNGFLYRVNRHRAQMELYIQKRKALGYTIAIAILVTISVMCWIVAP